MAFPSFRNEFKTHFLQRKWKLTNDQAIEKKKFQLPTWKSYKRLSLLSLWNKSIMSISHSMKSFFEQQSNSSPVLIPFSNISLMVNGKDCTSNEKYDFFFFFYIYFSPQEYNTKFVVQSVHTTDVSITGVWGSNRNDGKRFLKNSTRLEQDETT